MQDRFTNSLLSAISNSRFVPYRGSGISEYADFAHYIWNVALCESLYPVLQGLEVTLRNSIHDATTNALHRNDWFDSILVARETRSLENAKARLKSQNKNLYPDDLIAALSLGFWINLFYSSYEQKLWPRLLKEVFPYMPGHIRKRNYISRSLNPIRHLRNRVFHHEPVWHWPDLQQHHQETLEVIGWINPDMLRVIETIDRFPNVYAQGPEKYRAELLRLGSNQV